MATKPYRSVLDKLASGAALAQEIKDTPVEQPLPLAPTKMLKCPECGSHITKVKQVAYSSEIRRQLEFDPETGDLIFHPYAEQDIDMDVYYLCTICGAGLRDNGMFIQSFSHLTSWLTDQGIIHVK